MAEVIRMPRMSDTMEEGVIVQWLKGEGDAVEAGETLAEVETDKATMELDSFTDGVLLHIAVEKGTVPINGVIAVIGEAGEDWKAAIEAVQDDSNGNTETPSVVTGNLPKEELTVGDVSTDKSVLGGKRIKASPLARNMAKEAGIDISEISGSGDQGRIVKRDIEVFLETQAPAPTVLPTQKTLPVTPAAPTPQPPKTSPAAEVQPFVYASGEGNFEEIPVSQMRKTIARRLGESKFSAPHFYLTIEIDMGKAIQLRKRLNEVAPTKLSFNDLVLKTAAIALRQHPKVNTSWLGDKLRMNKDVNIGVAVAVEEGLLVPVIRYADIKTLSQINVEVKAYAEKANNKKLQPEEMQGNTFTISNLGMFGIEEFTAIINPPDSCIMAVGTIVEKPVVKDGQIVIGQRMKVTLSCDHRVVDGATGSQFLKTFKSILEDPIRIMV
ncbi:MAG: 2-oxo acid dehydrogenase subunit E2 [Bacteroidetes bacterium]|nr:2-oxo acid dehydrogenase subunit E2 [Bacteroidota bacterium]